MGLPVICIDARHAKAALKMQINKSDRNDGGDKMLRSYRCVRWLVYHWHQLWFPRRSGSLPQIRKFILASYRRLS
jgi:hypothetical protein